MSRTFTDTPAKREAVPLLVGLVGCSGSGKTFSALRLATGMQSVCGGEIFYIDTEARRALWYADAFKFKHIDFKEPFGSLDYLAAIEHCANQGAKIIIVDSMSHEHEGIGGVLESHEAEADRLAALWRCSRDKANMSAWQKPKSERRKMLSKVLQMSVNFIFCFRAKEKINLSTAKPTPMGWMPIAGEEFIYEMSVNCLLMPNAGGVPTWHPQEMGEKAIIKLPQQFQGIFAKQEPLSESIGSQLAQWAKGGIPQESTVSKTAPAGQADSPKATVDLEAPVIEDVRFESVVGKEGKFTLKSADGRIFSCVMPEVIEFLKKHGRQTSYSITHYGDQIEQIEVSK